MGKGDSKLRFNQVEGSRNKSRRKCINDALPCNNHHGDTGDLYKQLWQACAGPLVYVPLAGEKVVYFPQGHMEQVEACVNQDGKTEMPRYNLPSKIFCRVVNVQLKAEAGTDEVFAQITLLPETKQDMQSLKEAGNSVPLPHQSSPRSFNKKLTLSDTSTHGGFSVLKRHAEDCLSPMDMSGEPPKQMLFAKDVHGLVWNFHHVYRGNPRRHLLTTGWSAFVTAKKLLPGDVFVFLRGENGELRVGVRRAMKLLSSASTNVISAQSMRHGILAMAVHAINTGTMFTVYYRPWSSAVEFIIPFDQYLESAEVDYSVGTRFRMQFEGEECSEPRIERFEGTIVGNEDLDHSFWPNSEWRHLKVKWDAAPEEFNRPDRVSPWMIEPIEPVKKHTSPLHPSKRSRAVNASLSEFACVVKGGSLGGAIECTTPNCLGVLQGQEKENMDVNGLGTLKPPTSPHSIPRMPDLNHKPVGSGNQPWFSAHGPFHPCLCHTILFSGGNIKTRFGLPASCCSPLSSYRSTENAVGSRNLPVLDVNSCIPGSQRWRTLDANEISHAPPDGGGRYMLFGVNLVKNPPELPSPQVVTSNDRESFNSVPQMSQSSLSDPSKIASCTDSESQGKTCCYSSTNLSCTKVLKFGAAGRSVDLSMFNGYDELIRELDQRFGFEGTLIDGSSGWQVTYDDEGDMMLVGDCPWKLSI